MSRTRVRRRRIVVGAAVLVGGLWAGSAASAHAQHPETHFARYVVRPGDTLWGIATRMGGPRSDPRPLVEAIQEANQDVAVLQPGEVLQIPVST